MKRLVLSLSVFGLLLIALFSSRLTPGPASTDEPGKRPSDWAWLQRTFPHFEADADAYRTALAQAHALRSAAKQAPFGAWTFAGPTNVGGRVVDLEFAPQAPSTVYAAAATGGIFKSTDAGQTWRPIFDDLSVLTMGDLAVDPLRPNIVYAGTGEANGGHNNFAGGGLYKSVDGGAAWTYVGLEETVSIGRVLVDPQNPERIFVAGAGSYFAPHPERGVYRSLDGGATWGDGPVLFISDSTGVIDLVQRPDRPDTLFAAAWQRVRRPTGAQLGGPESGIYRSYDGGDTWERLGPEHGLPNSGAHRLPSGTVLQAGRIGLAICASQPDVLYALYTSYDEAAGTYGYLGLYRSDDGGETWYDFDPDRRVRSAFGTFSWYFGQVRVHPQDPDRVYVMDVLLATWDKTSASWRIQSGTHVDHHALAFHPQDPSFVLNGNDGGIARSTNGGATWTRVDDLPVTQFYEIGIDPAHPERLYGGTQDNGTVRTRTGALDDWDGIYGGDGFYVIVDPTNPNVVYAESQYGQLGKSTDGGATFRRAMAGIDPGDRSNWSTPVVMDPSNPQILYYGTHRIYRTTDGAASWTAISGGLTRTPPGTSSLGTITTIAVAPSDPRVLYAGTDDGYVWVTSDAEATWTNVTHDLPYRWVTRIAVHPHHPDTAYVTFSGLKWRDAQPHVFRTTDRGASWQDVSANLPDAPVNAFAIDPARPEVLYLGSDVGAFVSLDGGERWEPLGEGLPAVPVYDLKVHPTARYLVAGTHGRSMYRLDLSPLASGQEPPLPAVDDLRLDPGFPNPFSAAVTLPFQLRTPGHVRLEVYDLLGRRLHTLLDRPFAPGTHSIQWNGTDASGRFVPAGTYVARLTRGDLSRTMLVTFVP